MKHLSEVYFILLAVSISVAGQLLIKRGMNLMGPIDFSPGILDAYLRIFASRYVVAGCFTYLGSLFLWLYALSKVDLSFAYPFLALSYVLVSLSSCLFLGETIPVLRWVGIVVICFGVFLVSRG